MVDRIIEETTKVVTTTVETIKAPVKVPPKRNSTLIKALDSSDGPMVRFALQTQIKRQVEVYKRTLRIPGTNPLRAVLTALNPFNWMQNADTPASTASLSQVPRLTPEERASQQTRLQELLHEAGFSVSSKKLTRELQRLTPNEVDALLAEVLKEATILNLINGLAAFGEMKRPHPKSRKLKQLDLEAIFDRPYAQGSDIPDELVAPTAPVAAPSVFLAHPDFQDGMALEAADMSMQVAEPDQKPVKEVDPSERKPEPGNFADNVLDLTFGKRPRPTPGSGGRRRRQDYDLPTPRPRGV